MKRDINVPKAEWNEYKMKAIVVYDNYDSCKKYTLDWNILW